LQFPLQAASPETFGYNIVGLICVTGKYERWLYDDDDDGLGESVGEKLLILTGVKLNSNVKAELFL
jgi:hypothetical protein